MASGLAEHADRRVHLRGLCVVGSAVVRPGPPGRPGAADRARRRGHPDRRQRRHPRDAALAVGAPPLRGRAPSACGRVEVVVGTCPDLGTVKPIAPPLKQVARIWSRRLAAAQTIAVLEEGGRTVSLGSMLGEEFAAAPALLFGPDQFHPSADGYRALVDVLMPSAAGQPRAGPRRRDPTRGLRGEGVLPVTRAARAGGQRGRHRAGRHRGRRRPPRRARSVGGAATPPPPGPGRRAGPGRARRGPLRVFVRPPEHSESPGSPRALDYAAIAGVSRTGGSPGSAAGWCRSRPG